MSFAHDHFAALYNKIQAFLPNLREIGLLKMKKKLEPISEMKEGFKGRRFETNGVVM